MVHPARRQWIKVRHSDGHIDNLTAQRHRPARALPVQKHTFSQTELQVQARSRQLRSRSDSSFTYVENPVITDGFCQRGSRRHATRPVVTVKVGKALAHLDEHVGSVVPEALNVEVAAGQILGKREFFYRCGTHLVPIPDPAPRLFSIS